MNREDFRKHYKAVSEYVRSATLYELNEKGDLMTYNEYDEELNKEKAIDEKVWAEIDCRENELGRKLTVEETEGVWKEMEKELCE